MNLKGRVPLLAEELEEKRFRVRKMIIDPHVHTNRSPCSIISFKQLILEALHKELDAVCITDHDTITKTPKTTQLKIFAGSEVSAKDGHILAYGISEPIPKVSSEEAIELIHEQGGIAIAAHPFRVTSNQLGDKIFDIKLDGIETLNWANRIDENRKASKVARILKLSIIGGSDAHRMADIGCVITVTPHPLNDIDDFIKSLKKGELKAKYNCKKI